MLLLASSTAYRCVHHITSLTHTWHTVVDVCLTLWHAVLMWLQNAQLAARTQEQLQAVQQEVQEAQHKADQVRNGCWSLRHVLLV